MHRHERIAISDYPGTEMVGTVPAGAEESVMSCTFTRIRLIDDGIKVFMSEVAVMITLRYPEINFWTQSTPQWKPRNQPAGNYQYENDSALHEPEVGFT
jgi:hypothetical protein